jgi:hypothetical protein
MGRLLKVGAWGRRVGYYHGTTTTHLFFIAIHPLLKDGLCCSASSNVMSKVIYNKILGGPLSTANFRL